ncbi:unnamed protein product [Candida verbasci]|uniref:Uncharacterized protein n=1 Tax=Candida verbasci TaxID=1227364 RepID=A0A9W4XBT7_9ASCO|nr:unnamed protein product [Candida verbasci]
MSTEENGNHTATSNGSNNNLITEKTATDNTITSNNVSEKKEKIVPRDVRLLHLIFATQGIQNYQDHVPLQLMDFAHRYTKSILKDALVYNDHTKPINTNTNLNSNQNTSINTDDIRLAIAARSNYQFKPVPPKELLLELAQERNSKPLPTIIPKWGLYLPPEKYCLTARDWDDIYDEPEEEEFDKQQQKEQKEQQQQQAQQAQQKKKMRTNFIPMLPPLLASIPEVKEDYSGQCLVERTARLIQFVDLGAPDLCNIQKISLSSKTEISTFLYFTGVDVSNTASIAAHLQSLSNLMTSKSQYWFGEKKHWKVPQLTYCTFNAFSKIDLRVTVHIPGKFEIQIVNQDGKILQIEKLSSNDLDKLWQETFITSIVRAVLENDEGIDENFNKIGGLVEIRKINPFNNGIVSKELLNNFLIGFETLFFQGHKLGCNIEYPQPTIVNNYLVDGFLKVIQLTQSYDRGLTILNRLYKTEPMIISLIAKLQLLKQDEIEAVKTMNLGILQNKRDSNLLILQAEFCLNKKKPELALELAKQAVKSSPSDFKTWSLLVKVYTKLGDFENALLTLNSCPMNSHKEKYQLKRVVPIKSNDDLHLPSPLDVTLDDVSNLQSNEISFEQKNLDPQLINLPATNLKSTFSKAYDLLTDIVIKTGWESLLKYRAKVFVMEEEYRKDKNNGHIKKNSTSSTSTLTVNNNEDVSSTIGIKSPESTDKINDLEFQDEFRKKRLCERWLDNLFMLLYEDLRAYTMWQAESLHFQAQQMEYKKSTLEWEILGSIAYRLKHFKEGSIAFANALSGRFSAKSQSEMLKYYLMEKNKLINKNTTTFTTTSNNNNSSSHLNSSGFIQNYSKLMNQLNEKILESIVKLLVWNHRWYSDFSPFLLINYADLVAWEGLLKIESSIKASYSEIPNKLINQKENKDKDGESVGNHGIIEMMHDLDVDYIKLYKLSNADE